MVALGGFFEKTSICSRQSFCWTLADNRHVIYHATFEGGSGGVGGKGKTRPRRVSGRQLNFQKTQLGIRFNIPPRKSAVKKAVENAVEKKVKNFSLENLEIRRKKSTEKSTTKIHGKIHGRIHGKIRGKKIHSENPRTQKRLWD